MLSTQVGASLACKYKIKVEVNGSGKFFSLINTATITAMISFVVQAPETAKIAVSVALKIMVLCS
jgi:hypothetical protein